MTSKPTGNSTRNPSDGAAKCGVSIADIVTAGGRFGILLTQSLGGRPADGGYVAGGRAHAG